MLQFMALQRIGHDLVTEQQQYSDIKCIYIVEETTLLFISRISSSQSDPLHSINTNSPVTPPQPLPAITILLQSLNLTLCHVSGIVKYLSFCVLFMSCSPMP